MAWPAIGWETKINRADMAEGLAALCVAVNERFDSIGEAEHAFTFTYDDDTTDTIERPTKSDCVMLGFRTGAAALFQEIYDQYLILNSAATWINNGFTADPPELFNDNIMDHAGWYHLWYVLNMRTQYEVSVAATITTEGSLGEATVDIPSAPGPPVRPNTTQVNAALERAYDESKTSTKPFDGIYPDHELLFYVYNIFGIPTNITGGIRYTFDCIYKHKTHRTYAISAYKGDPLNVITFNLNFASPVYGTTNLKAKVDGVTYNLGVHPGIEAEFTEGADLVIELDYAITYDDLADFARTDPNYGRYQDSAYADLSISDPLDFQFDIGKYLADQA